MRFKGNEQAQQGILQLRLVTLGKSFFFNKIKSSKGLLHHSLCLHRKKEMGFNRASTMGTEVSRDFHVGGTT